jgi:hypothetical protein
MRATVQFAGLSDPGLDQTNEMVPALLPAPPAQSIFRSGQRSAHAARRLG